MNELLYRAGVARHASATPSSSSTRIYFRQLEDAIGYMARRGYKRMVGDEEKEWRVVLERAHGVVKVGKEKDKQRYRKGKLVLILKKTIGITITSLVMTMGDR